MAFITFVTSYYIIFVPSTTVPINDFNKNVLNLLLITEGEKKHYVLISNDPQKKKENKEIADILISRFSFLKYLYAI